MRGNCVCISLFFVLFSCGAHASFFGDILYDCVDIPKNLFTPNGTLKETVCCAAAFVPAFFFGSEYDESIHNRHFCYAHKKNINQFPEWCHKSCGDESAMIVDLSVAALLLCWPDREMRTMGHVFLIGSLYVEVAKNLLKKIEWDHNYRPLNSHFDCSHRHYGGCPSGHMALSLYMATFFGRAVSPFWALPFGIWAGAIFVDSLNSNRHYLSQLLAGGCLGIAFGFAAAQTFFNYEKDGFSCGIGVGTDGGPVVRAAYEF